MKRRLFAVAAIALVASSSSAERPADEPSLALRVCADPDNLPYSNQRGEGFENAIAELLAKELAMRVETTWWAQRRGFFRNTLKAGRCDVVLGAPTGIELALTTQPYYRSAYAFVTRADAGLQITSFDDPRLRHLRIAVPIVGDDGANPTPAHALSRRGIVDNVTGYPVYADRGQKMPLALQAVSKRKVDVAILWGPIAGWFAHQSEVPLSVKLAARDTDGQRQLAFDISLAVRHGNRELKERLDAVLIRKKQAIQRILRAAHVPTR